MQLVYNHVVHEYVCMYTCVCVYVCVCTCVCVRVFVCTCVCVVGEGTCDLSFIAKC